MDSQLYDCRVDRATLIENSTKGYTALNRMHVDQQTLEWAVAIGTAVHEHRGRLACSTQSRSKEVVVTFTVDGFVTDRFGQRAIRDPEVAEASIRKQLQPFVDREDIPPIQSVTCQTRTGATVDVTITLLV